MRVLITSLVLPVLLAAVTSGASAQTFKAEPSASPSPQPDLYRERTLRARANLEALLAGRRSTSQLSQQELQDVIDLERIIRAAGRSDTRSLEQRCVDEEVRRNGGNPSPLAWEVIRLTCRR